MPSEKYFLKFTATHECYGPTLHIAKRIDYMTGTDPLLANTASMEMFHPDGVKAVAFFAHTVMGLHVCFCDNA